MVAPLLRLTRQFTSCGAANLAARKKLKKSRISLKNGTLLRNGKTMRFMLNALSSWLFSLRRGYVKSNEGARKVKSCEVDREVGSNNKSGLR